MRCRRRFQHWPRHSLRSDWRMPMLVSSDLTFLTNEQGKLRRCRALRQKRVDRFGWRNLTMTSRWFDVPLAPPRSDSPAERRSPAMLALARAACSAVLVLLLCAPVHGFRLLDYSVDADVASPRACFQFSE